MKSSNYNIEKGNASNEGLGRSSLTQSEISYLKELDTKLLEWERLSLENKIAISRDIDNRVEEISESTGIAKTLLYQEYFPDIRTIRTHQHSGGMVTWNDRWIQSHLIDISKLENVKDYMETNRYVCGKFAMPELKYVGEILPLGNTDLLIARIDELNGRKPPKAIDSDRAVAELLEPIKDKIDPLYLEAPSDNAQVEAISDVMLRVERLEYDKWKDLSFDKRMGVLQQLENEVAKIAHRPSCVVVSQSLGEGHLGYYEQGSNCITINKDYVESTESYEAVLDTLIHEGRHAYQDYNLNVRETHPRHGEVSNWNLNELHGYQDVEHCGFKAYQLQPLESDARAFAEDVVKSYQDKLT